MAKAEQSPPFQMTVENGRLAPVTPWDAERLSTYRNGSNVNVVITQEKASWRQRKYWAILNAVVKSCPVKQRRAEDLHKAIRLKLGIVDSFTTLGGSIKVELRSTTSMDEQEFEAFYHEAMDLLRDVTGVDVETLGKEASDVGHEEQESSGSSEPDAGSGEEASPCEDPAPTNPAAADQAEPEETVKSSADSSGSAIDNVTRNLMVEAMDKFLYLATDKDVPDPKERRGILAKTKDAWKDALPQHHSFVKACFEAADRIIKGKSKEADEREYLAGLVERAQA